MANSRRAKHRFSTVKSGAAVKIDTGGGAGWRNAAKQDPNAWLKENGVPTTVEDTGPCARRSWCWKTPRDAGIENGHLLVGPIAIEGAMPGDSLEVRILSVVPRIPYRHDGPHARDGGLRSNRERASADKVTILDLKRNVGVFEPGVEVPLGPFMG